MAAPVHVGQYKHLQSARERWRERLRVSQKFGIPMNVIVDAYKVDLAGIERGGMPMSDHDAFVAVQGLTGQSTETGAGKGWGPLGVLERATEDLKTIVHTLPQLPKFLVDEVNLLSDSGPEGFSAQLGKVQGQISDGDLRGAIETAAMAPGIRLTPGSYVAHELAGGRPEELVEHPVFTLLDILPIASKAGLTTKLSTAVKQLPPYKKAVQSLANRGIGSEATETARLIAQRSRSIRGEGPEPLAIPVGPGTGPFGVKLGTYDEFVRNLAKNVGENLTLEESKLLFDVYESGDAARIAALPANVKAAYAWTKPVFDWLREHGVSHNELVKIGDYYFPNDTVTRRVIKAMKTIDAEGVTPSGVDEFTKTQGIIKKNQLKAAFERQDLRLMEDADTTWRTETREGVSGRLDELGGRTVDDPAAGLGAAIVKALEEVEAIPPRPMKKVFKPGEGEAVVYRPGEEAWRGGERTAAGPEDAVGERRVHGRETTPEGEAYYKETVIAEGEPGTVVRGRLVGEATLRHAEELTSKIRDGEAKVAALEAEAGFTGAELTELLEGWKAEKSVAGSEGKSLRQYAEEMIVEEAGGLRDFGVHPLSADEVTIKVRQLDEQGYRQRRVGKEKNRIDPKHRGQKGAPVEDAQRYVEEGAARISHVVDDHFNRSDANGAYFVDKKSKRYKMDPTDDRPVRDIYKESPLHRLKADIKKRIEKVAEQKAELAALDEQIKADATAPVAKADEVVTATEGLIGDAAAKSLEAARKRYELGRQSAGRRAEEKRKKAAEKGEVYDYAEPAGTAEVDALIWEVEAALEDAASQVELIEIATRFGPVIDEVRKVAATPYRGSIDKVVEAINNALKGGPGEVGMSPAAVVDDTMARARKTLLDELAENEAYLENLGDTVGGAEAAYLAVEKEAGLLLDAMKELDALQRTRESMRAHLEKVRSGESPPSHRVSREPGKPVRQTRLEAIYRTLDDIDKKGEAAAEYGNKSILLDEAARLEAAGVVAEPRAAKVRAREGREVEVPAGPPSEARVRAEGRVAELQAARKSVLPFMVQLRAAQKLMREAAEDIRLRNDPTAAKKKLKAAQSRVTPTDGGPTSHGGIARAVLKNPEVGKDFVAAVDEMTTEITSMLDTMPSTKTVQKAAEKIVEQRTKLNKTRARIRTGRKTNRNRTKKARDRVAKGEETKASFATSARGVPAEWLPNLNEIRKALVREAVLAVEDAPHLERALRAVQIEAYDEAFKLAGVDPKVGRKITKEVVKEVHDLIQSGEFTPEYLPHRQIDKIQRRSSSRMFQTKAQTAQQFHRRGINPEPYVRDLALAVHDSMLDHLRITGMEHVIFGVDEVVKGGQVVTEAVPGIFEMFGRSKMDLVDMYNPEIAALEARGVDSAQAASMVLRRDWTTVDPTSWGFGEKWHGQRKVRYGRKGLDAEPGADMLTVTEIYVPRAVAKTLDDFQGKGGMFPYTHLYDKAMDVFRISALALSPRFLVYNGIGGFVMTQARTGPGLVGRLREAAEMVKGNKMPTEISRGTAYAPPELTRQFDPRIKLRDPTQESKFMLGMAEGALLGDIWNKVQSFSSKSFQLNEWFDNVYRAAAYLDEVDKLKATGASAETAAREGIKLANKVLQDWDAMLPWERTVMRRIFPFYGWMKHIIKYTFTLPFDHPMRVGIVTNFAEAEMKDRQEGLPQWMSGVFFMGTAGKDSKQWSFTTAGANPFSDVVDYVQFDSREWGSGALLGFLSQTSPLAGAILETTGVNPMTGRANLYPEIKYDPERGRLQAVAPTPFETLPSAFVPQVRGVWGLLELAGIKTPATQIRELRHRDPDAFHARIFSAFGIPFAPRRRSVPEETVRAALARDQAATEAVNRALRTGIWEDALRYDRAYIRGQQYDVNQLYRMAEQDPDLLEVILNAASR